MGTLRARAMAVVSTRHSLPASTATWLAMGLSLVVARSATGLPPPDLAVELVVSGLISPVTARHAGDGSGRLFIVEQGGRIRIWDGNSLLPTPFLDITSLVDSGGNEQGLLGLDFHPDYATNGYFYVNYTRDPGPGLDRTVVARYNVSADPNVAVAGSAVTLLEVAQDFGNHNGGNILFGPDGYLYIGMGDGGSGGDPNDRAQDMTVLLGKMLRIDVNGTPPSSPNDLCGLVQNYGIPPDNPFVGGSGDCDEIWQSGLRNPWRFSFDRLNGELFIGDVGQNGIEEIDFQPSASGGGENWGWRCYEGSSGYDSTNCGAPAGYYFPILEYSHSFGCSVTGGYRYTGSAISGLLGYYLYADYCSGRLWAAAGGAAGWNEVQVLNLPFNVSSFGEDELGELYIVDHGGSIYRLTSPSSIFADGFESDDVSAWADSYP